MKAFVFPGQGAQYTGMGKDLYENNETARELFEKANDILGFRITNIMFEGTADELKQTKVTQPAVFLHSVIRAICMGDEFRPDMVGGHSLGEFSALVAAGVLGFEDGLRLVYARAMAMQAACDKAPGTMAAVINLTDEVIEKICSEVSAMGKGTVVPANYNCPGQIVISGDEKAVDEAVKLLQEKGARKVIPLAVSGPFHTSLMKPAGDKLAKKFEEINFGEPSVKVVYNKTATEIQDGETIQGLLEQQVQSSVYLEDSIRYMISKGVDTFIEIGPGKTLSGFVKKVNRKVKILNIEKVEDLEKLKEVTSC